MRGRRSRRPVLALGLLPPAAVAAAGPAQAAWTRPVVVMPALRAGDPAALRPSVAMRTDRSAMAAWTSPATRRFFVAVRRAKLHPTAGWTSPATLGTSKGTPLTGAVVRAGGNNAVVAWSARQRTADPEIVRTWLSRPGVNARIDGPATAGRTFTPVASVTPGGEVVAVWQEPGGPWAGVRDAETGGWTRQRLDPSLTSGDWSMASLPSGAAVAAWRGLTAAPAGTRGVAASVRQPGGAFGPPERVDGSYDLPVVAMRPDGSPVVLLTGAGIRATSRGAGGWSAPVAVSGDAVSTATPVSVAALPDGRLIVAYRAVAGTTTRIMVVAERTPAGAWNAPAALTPSRRGLGDPQIAASPGGRLAVVWLQEGRVLSRLRPAGATRWTATEGVSPSSRNCRAPAVAVGSDGRAVSVFPCRVASGAMELLAAQRPVG